MAKRLVPHFELGKKAHRGIVLHADIANAITCYWMKTATEAQKGITSSTLKDAHTDGNWIACDCQDKDGKATTNPPILMVGTKTTESKGTTLYLFQRQKRPKHAESCPFAISDEEYERRAKEREGKDNPPAAIDLDKVPTLMGGMKTRDKMASRDDSGPTSEGISSEQEDPLFGVLAWLIEKAGLHRSTHEPKKFADQWAAIDQFASSVKLEDQMTFRDLLIRGEHNLIGGRFQSQFKAIAAKTHTDREKVAYLLIIADALQRNEDGSTSITIRHWVTGTDGKPQIKTEIERIFCDIKHPARDGDEAKAPYLVLIRLVDTNTRQARASKGVAQPIFDQKNLFPVDSNQERKTYRKLLQVGCSYAKRGGRLKIEKPVRWRNTPMGVCRPDFIVWDEARPSPQHTIIVETMGFDTPEYRERKAKTTAMMREIGNTLIEDDRTGKIPDLIADNSLYNAIMDVLVAFAKVA